MVSGLYNTIEDYTSASGIMPLLFSIRDGVPFAFEVMLVGIFVLLFAGQYFITKAKTGKAKILIALLSSSIVMIILSMMVALAQLVTYVTVVFYTFLTIILFILFLISDNG